MSQRELGARVDPHHEPAGAVRLEGGGDNDVAAGAEGSSTYDVCRRRGDPKSRLYYSDDEFIDTENRG